MKKACLDGKREPGIPGAAFGCGLSALGAERDAQHLAAGAQLRLHIQRRGPQRAAIQLAHPVGRDQAVQAVDAHLHLYAGRRGRR